MGYRERQAHRNKQKQQSLGQAYTPEQRVTLPAPKTMNSRDNPLELPPDHAPLLEDVIPADGGLKVLERPSDRWLLTSTSATNNGPFVTYYGSGSSSAEFWVQCGSYLHRLTGTPTFPVSTASTDISIGPGDWVEFNKTIIYTTGLGTVANQRMWDRANGWTLWSASVSGVGSTGRFWGVASFKSRLFAWERFNNGFYYSSVDQVLGTFKPFRLDGVMQGRVMQMVTLPNDGGDGPDDYAAFISETGDVAVYAGTDPGDASNWSLVGVYKIGKPVARDAHYKHGNQVVIMCEDDFYFLPRDMTGEKQRTVAAEYRAPDDDGFPRVNAVFNSHEEKVIFGDGSVFDPGRGWAYSTITLTSAAPHQVRRSATQFHGGSPGSGSNRRPTLGEFKGKTYVLAENNSQGSASADLMLVREIMAPSFVSLSQEEQRKARIRTAPIPTRGRTNISLVNPIFGFKPNSTTTAGEIMELVYKAGVDYDNYQKPYTTASADLLSTASAAVTSRGQWLAGFGAGDKAQLYIETISASSDRDIYLYGFDITVSDTGGI